MALYATFLVTVGLPLLALTVDYSRAWLGAVQLRTSTQAFCQAYANAIDLTAYSADQTITFKASEVRKAYINLARSSPAGAQVSPASRITGGGDTKVMTVTCTGTVYVDTVIGFVYGPIKIEESAVAKTKLGTTMNW
jgi:hypothetical protein